MSFHFRAALGAVDQALTAAANFLLGVMVARLGGVSALGSFAFANTMIVMASMLHGAMLGEVYSVNDAARAGQRRFGAGILFSPTMLLAVAMVVVSQVLLFWGDQGRAVSSVSFVAALMLSMFFWSAKVHFYCEGAPGKALLSSTVYGIVMLATTYLSYHAQGNQASPFTGVAAGAGCAVLLLIPSVRRIPVRDESLSSFAAAIVRYAKWSVPAAGLIWLANNGYYLLMPAGSDIEQTAGLRAILNLLVPFNTLLVGASAALLPLLAQVRKEKGRAELASVTHRMAALVLLGAAIFAAIVAVLSGRLLGMIYGHQFEQFAPALRVASLLPALWGVVVVYRTSIRAMGESFDLFKVYFFALVPVGITLMLVMSRGGASHAVIGVALTQLLIVAGFIYRFVVMTRERHEVQLRQG